MGYFGHFGDTQFVRGYAKPRDMDGAFVGDYSAAFNALDEYGDADPSASMNADDSNGASQDVVIIPNRAQPPSALFWLFGGLVLAKVFSK